MRQLFNARTGVVAIVLAVAVPVAGCDPAGMGSVDGKVAIGTWGGNDAGVIVIDALAHVHLGCTNGDIQGRIALDAEGRFVVAGSYQLHAYPVALGPTMPAQFTGKVDGGTMTFSIAVTDTIEHAVTMLGPATVVLGKEPSMGPCPICRTPGDRARMLGAARR